ncbi:MAG: M48 family metalloprotease [Desulfobulbus sp.]|jgi:predicted Zn-dependent protease|nr:M48 family metalloprotease [Desulfobulbus sp.]
MTAPRFDRRELLRLVGLGVSSLAAAPLLSSCAVNPTTGSRHLMVLSEEEEIHLDRQQAPQQFSSDYGPVRDKALNTYLDGVGQNLAARSHRPHLPYSFRAVNAAYINAYAFPGGSIAATRGILVELENEAELSGLLGHEIGHVNARHSAQQASKSLLTNIFVSGASFASSLAGLGAASDLVQGVGNLGAGALLARYSRDNEREADALGMAYQTRAGYSPEGMVGLMRMLQKNGRSRASAIEMMFATHPMSDERLKNVETAATTTYRDSQGLPLHRERYLDNTARVRAQRPLITALQKGDEAMGKKHWALAEEQFNQAIRLGPDDYAAQVMLAKCFLAQDRRDEAERHALHATAIYPEEAQAHVLVGATSLSGKKFAQAYEHLATYDRLLPGNKEVLFFLGYSLENMNRKEEAARKYAAYLQREKQGQQAQYAASRLKEWGYAR